jgi:hypothetical protein
MFFIDDAGAERQESPAGNLVAEAEAQRALAELFPHLKLDALRAIQELFPLAREHAQVVPATNAVH